MVETANEGSSLEDRKASLLASITTAAGKGDVDTLLKLQSELSKLRKEGEVVVEEAEKGAREAFIFAATANLAKMSVPSGYTVQGILRKSEDGTLDDLTISITNEKLPDGFYAALGDFKDIPSTVRAVQFEIGAGKATVTLGAPRRSSSGGGTSGKGWVKDGATHKLDDVFQANATAEDKAELATAQGDGNKQYAIKTRVAKRSGHVKGD